MYFLLIYFFLFCCNIFPVLFIVYRYQWIKKIKDYQTLRTAGSSALLQPVVWQKLFESPKTSHHFYLPVMQRSKCSSTDSAVSVSASGTDGRPWCRSAWVAGGRMEGTEIVGGNRACIGSISDFVWHRRSNTERASERRDVRHR